MFLDPDADPREGGPRLGRRADDAHRVPALASATLELKCSGLDAGSWPAASVEPSTMSLLGLVRHMAEVERSWFRRRLAGQDARRTLPDAGHSTGTSTAPSPTPRSSPRRGGLARGGRVRRASSSPPPRPRRHGPPRHRGAVSLRELLVHMVEEYARHNGHADLLRERIDGRLGQ